MAQPVKRAVLICDDEAEVRELIRDTLIQAYPNLIIVESIDGADAFSKVSRQVFDLVITDLHMPKRDGVKLIQTFKQLRDEFRPKKVIIISGKVSEEDVKASDLGAYIFLPKPCDFNLLKQEVSKALGGAASEPSTASDFRPEAVLLPIVLGSIMEVLSQYSETTFQRDQVVASKDLSFSVQEAMIQRFGHPDFNAYYVLSLDEGILKFWSEKKLGRAFDPTKLDAYELLKAVNASVFSSMSQQLANTGLPVMSISPLYLRGKPVEMVVAHGAPRVVAKFVCERGAVTVFFATDKNSMESSGSSLV